MTPILLLWQHRFYYCGVDFIVEPHLADCSSTDFIAPLH